MVDLHQDGHHMLPLLSGKSLYEISHIHGLSVNKLNILLVNKVQCTLKRYIFMRFLLFRAK